MYDNEKRQAVLATYRKTLGNVTATCKAHGITPQTFYNWCEEDEAYGEEARRIKNEEFGDFVESALLQRIQEGDTKAIIFALKTRFKDRGYSEKIEVQADLTSGGKPLTYQDIMPHNGTDEQTT